MKIDYIEHKEINFRKWDECIRNSIQGNLYANSWYLDIISENWDALVLNDYEAVMPLTQQKKYGIQYLIQPFFAQQLGVYSSRNLNPELVTAFLNAIPSKFKYININLNKFNSVTDIKFDVKRNHNFELDLIYPYEQIAKKYSENTRRNISKAKKEGLQMHSNTCSVKELMHLIKNNVAGKVENLPSQKYNDIQKIISLSIQQSSGEIISVYNANNSILAAVFFIYSHNKAIYLFAASNEEGKEKRAMFFLVDEFIKKYAERNITLDFEGSNIEGLARFYRSFGANDCEYLTVKKNNLPFPLKLLKK